jgi:hypothetical protein
VRVDRAPTDSSRIDKASFPVTVRAGHCGHGTFWEGLLGVRQWRECAVVQIDAETLEVELPHKRHAEQARLERDLYLRVWQSLHEWSRVEYVEKL